MINADIDIDVKSSFNPLKIFNGSKKASIVQDGKLRPHPCGVYFQKIPSDPITGLAAIPYKEAEELEFLKIDFLHLSLYDKFESRSDIENLLKVEPNWSLLKIPSVVKQLFQLSNHFEILNKVSPKSINQLADVLALIRPSKRFLIPYYLKDPAKYRTDLYKKSVDESYGFKKAHAVAYALTIVLQLHLIECGHQF